MYLCRMSRRSTRRRRIMPFELVISKNPTDDLTDEFLARGKELGISADNMVIVHSWEGYRIERFLHLKSKRIFRHLCNFKCPTCGIYLTPRNTVDGQGCLFCSKQEILKAFAAPVKYKHTCSCGNERYENDLFCQKCLGEFNESRTRRQRKLFSTQ